jgi:hypothetical protein
MLTVANTMPRLSSVFTRTRICSHVCLRPSKDDAMALDIYPFYTEPTDVVVC